MIWTGKGMKQMSICFFFFVLLRHREGDSLQSFQHAVRRLVALDFRSLCDMRTIATLQHAVKPQFVRIACVTHPLRNQISLSGCGG